MWLRRMLIRVFVVVVICGCGAEKWPLSESPPSTAGTTTPVSTEPLRGRGNPTTTSPGFVGANQGLFESARGALEATLRAQPDPKLTALSYDMQNNVVIVTFVYKDRAAAPRSRYDDFAWQTGQTLSDSFWFPELVETFPSHHADPAWLPKLRIQIDDVVYLCSAAVQIAVAAHRTSQRDWITNRAA